jgi:DNA-binding GntR family transcriptional regulator
MELVDKVRDEIFSMTLNDCQIREQDLTAKFKVSRTSIRDVLKQLQVEKLIDRKRNKGISLHHFSLKEIADLYDLRAALEGFAGRLVTDKISAEQLIDLRKLADEYCKNKKTSVSVEFRSELDDKFHRMIVDIADNQHLKDIMQQSSILKRAFSVNYKNKNQLKNIYTPYSHSKIIDAIEAGDGALAEELLRKHCLWAKQRLLARFTGVKAEDI